jgi:hypothetical protein
MTKWWLLVAAMSWAATTAAAPQQSPAPPSDTLSTAVPSVRHARHRPLLRHVPPRRGVIDGRPIRRVTIEPHNVYEPGGPAGLAGFHRVADRLHIRTRTSTVQSYLLFRPGDIWSDALARETARNLRALDFIDPQLIEAHRVGDSVDVRIETRDVWTTSPEFNIESGGGRQTGSFGFTERNLLGLGKSVSVSYREDAVGVSRHFGYDDPNLGGSRGVLHTGAGKSAEGASAQFNTELPFYAEATPLAYGSSWDRSTFVAHLFQRGSETASIDERVEQGAAWFGGRVGHDGQIVRLTGSFEFEDRRRGPTRLAPGASLDFAGGEEEVRRRLVAAKLRWWMPRYVELEDINRLDRVEDFDLGPSATMKFGFSPRFLGSTADEAHLELGIDTGIENGAGFGWVRCSTTGWMRPSPVDMISRVDARWYFIPPGHTIALGAFGLQGSRVSRDFQASIGGLNGLRAYAVQAVSGRQVWRFNAEDRWIFSPEDWQLLTLGTAAFYDAARGWGAGAEGDGWFQDAGVGLRIGLPQLGLSQVLRFDVAWPISPTRDGRREAVFSFGSNQAF